MIIKHVNLAISPSDHHSFIIHVSNISCFAKFDKLLISLTCRYDCKYRQTVIYEIPQDISNLSRVQHAFISSLESDLSALMPFLFSVQINEK